MTDKECTKCGIFKDVSAFYNKINYCKECRISQIIQKYSPVKAAEATRYYQANKEKIQARRKVLRNTLPENKFKHMWRNSKQRALSKGFEFDIEWVDLWNLWESQDKICALSGQQMELAGGMLSNKVSLDRIDSKMGYTKNNIQLVTVKVNYMKRDMDQGDFISLCKEVGQYA